jgi:hypothetical protein
MNDIAQRSTFITEAAKEVANLDDPVKWDYYAGKLSAMSGTDKGVVMGVIRRVSNADMKPEVIIIPEQYQAKSEDERLLKLIGFILESKDNYEFFCKNEGYEGIFDGDEELKSVYQMADEYYHQNHPVDNLDFFNYNNKIAYIMSKINAQGILIDKDQALSLLDNLIISKYEDELRAIKRKIKQAEANSDEETAILLLKEHSFYVHAIIAKKRRDS